jgi:hypothetical protein
MVKMKDRDLNLKRKQVRYREFVSGQLWLYRGLSLMAFVLALLAATTGCGGGGGGGDASGEAVNATYTVTYDGNGSDGGSVPSDATQYESGQSVTVSENSGNLTRDKYIFAGWSMSPDGSGASYWPEELFAMGAENVTLYAMWAPVGLAYKLINNDTGYEVSKGTADTNGRIAIPKYWEGKPVNSIGVSAFASCTGLTGVTIPDSVTSIGDYAFYYCTGLTGVTIGNSVTSIGSHAFYKCTGLTGVTIGNSVTSIGVEAFLYCTGLMNIDVDSANTNYSSLNGVLFDKSKTIIVQYPGGRSGSYSIPDSVTSIWTWAFGGCTGLTGVTIPDRVTSIGYAAFASCTGLTGVTIPDSVTSIGDYAFYYCIGLTGVTIGNSVTSIGDYAFHLCTSLTGVTIPVSVTSIGNWAFAVCTGLKDVNVQPATPPAAGVNIFDGDSNLVSIHVPAGKVPDYQTADGWSRYSSKIVTP